MPTVHVNDTRLEYVERGRGDPVVLVHGTLGDHRSWPLQMDVFPGTYRTISYSRRYHHPNGCDDGGPDYSAVLHADELAELITGLGLESAHIVGNSYGAYTALFLAARHPDRVRTLVLGEPPVLPLLDDHPEGRGLRDEFLAEVWEPAGGTLQQGRLEEGVRIFADGVVGEGAFDSLPPEIRGLILDNAPALGLETASPRYWTPFTCEDAADIATPTLLLTGEESLRMLNLVVIELGRCLPDSECRWVPDSNHDLPAHNPGAYNRIVLEFLARQAG